MHVLTAFSTNCGRVPLMIFMAWKTSIACSIFIRSRRFEMAMYVPVRPAPSLKYKLKRWNHIFHAIFKIKHMQLSCIEA